MPKPFLQEFVFGDLKLTSVVIDANDFESFCDDLAGIMEIEKGIRANENTIQSIKKTGILPLMSRGNKTEKFFTKWGVKTDKMSVIKRGFYEEMTKKIIKEQSIIENN